MSEPTSVASVGNGGISVIQACQSHRSLVYRRPEGFCCLRVLKETRGAMQDISLHWNHKKCSVVHAKKGALVLNESGMRIDETTTIMALGERKHYKFLGC